MQNAFLLFTKIMFDNFFVCACAQIKILSFWTINRPTTSGFSVFIYFFALPFSLLPSFLLQLLVFYRVLSGRRISEKA